MVIVDDYEDARVIYDTYLTYRGYRVLTASSGQECIDLTQREQPSLILLDIRMPRMTGLETIRALRSDDTLKRVPIVALTAYALADEERQLLAAGFDEVIAKPCVPNDLEAAIVRLLATPRGADRVRYQS